MSMKEEACSLLRCEGYVFLIYMRTLAYGTRRRFVAVDLEWFGENMPSIFSFATKEWVLIAHISGTYQVNEVPQCIKDFFENKSIVKVGSGTASELINVVRESKTNDNESQMTRSS
jgi:hypothetical protein